MSAKAGTGAAVGDVVVRFADQLALAGVSLDSEPGTVTALVGGDGAGKTTLLRVLVGRVAPDSGWVRTPPRESIGYLPATLGSWRGLSVAQNVEFVGGSYGMDRARIEARSAELLGAAGLEDFRDRLSGELSGGMRRKLGVCLAMLHDPALLVLDEPSTGVDPVSRVDLWRLASAAAARGTTVVMSTTYLDEAERARQVLVLDAGRVLVAGSPAEVLARAGGVVTESERAVRPQWAWRRGAVFHELWPDDPPPDGLPLVSPDLEDVVVARSLALQHSGAATAGGAA